jgi:hypothetical protein
MDKKKLLWILAALAIMGPCAYIQVSMSRHAKEAARLGLSVMMRNQTMVMQAQLESEAGMNVTGLDPSPEGLKRFVDRLNSYAGGPDPAMGRMAVTAKPVPWTTGTAPEPRTLSLTYNAATGELWVRGWDSDKEALDKPIYELRIRYGSPR